MNAKAIPAIALLVVIALCIGTVSAGEPGSAKWTLAVGEEVWGLALAPDGTVYLSATHKLHAVSPDGKKKWATDLGGPDHHNPPSIGTDGTVYVSESGGSLHAMSPDGKEKWRYDHPEKGSNVLAKRLAAMLGPCAIGSDGTLYLKSMDCTVHAVGTDGKKRWSLRCGMLGTEVPCLASDGTLYVVGNETEHWNEGVHALDAGGKMRWFAKVDRYVDGAPAVGSDGTVYVVSSTDESTGKLFAISRDGKNLWEFKTGGGKGEPLRHKCSPSIGPDGTIYTGTAQKAGGQPGILYAVKPDGTEKWHFATKGQNAGPATIGKDGNVYFCSDNILYALTTDGAKKWEFKTDGKFASSPTIAPDGTIYVVSDKGTLYAVESSSKGLADSPWPMEGHDSRRTGRATGAKTD